MRYFIITMAAFLLLTPCAASAEEALKIPRFVSIKSDDANLRTGPNARYPIQWIHKKRSMPLEIIEEFEHWRKVRDVDGESGWIHKSLLSSKRFVIITARYAAMHSNPEMQSPLTLKLGKGVLARVDECLQDWCELTHERGTGWVMKKDFWGVYPDEIIN